MLEVLSSQQHLVLLPLLPSQHALSATEACSFKQAFQVSLHPTCILVYHPFCHPLCDPLAALSSAPNGSHLVSWGFLGLGG